MTKPQVIEQEPYEAPVVQNIAPVTVKGQEDLPRDSNVANDDNDM